MKENRQMDGFAPMENTDHMGAAHHKENTWRKDTYRDLLKEANDAIQSKSRALAHEIYGQAKMAYRCHVITGEQFWELNEILVVNGINNPSAGLV